LASGKIILLNGPSSAGKTTLARRLQASVAEPFWQYSIDLFRDARVLPVERIERGDFRWRELRPQLHDGFQRSLAAFAHAGNNLISDYIVETQASRDGLVELLNGLDVFFVGVHCALPELERREIARGDRRRGEARADFETIHQLCTYDVEVDTTAGVVDEITQLVLRAWTQRRSPSAFDRMRQARA
jgi:chloramphenicol 3-O phosphotransferase